MHNANYQYLIKLLFFKDLGGGIRAFSPAGPIGARGQTGKTSQIAPRYLQ
jgi:hypothetical protein